MKKLFTFMMLLFFVFFLGGCQLTDEEIGNKLISGINTLKGEDSVILHFEVDYVGGYSFNHEYDILINKLKNYEGLHMLSPDFTGSFYQDYRYIIYDEVTQLYNYYEYSPYDQSFSKSGALEKDDYVYIKLSFGEYEIPRLTLSIESIIEMINNEQITIESITSEDEDLKEYQLYEVMIDLSYFVENNEEVLKGLYGNKVEGNLSVFNGKTQKLILGYDKLTEELKYVSYAQDDLLNRLGSQFSEINIEIFIENVGIEAEEEMEAIENSTIFPNDSNVK